MFEWARMASTIWSPTRCTGLNEFIALWGTIEISCHRIFSRYSRSVMASRSWPRKASRSAVTFALAGNQAHDGPNQGGFPAARFPRQAEDLVLGDREGDAVHRFDRPGLALVVGPEILDVEQHTRVLSLPPRG